jgi:hypothetical protein
VKSNPITILLGWRFEKRINPEVVIFPTSNELLIFEARSHNICGWSEWKEYSVDLNVCDDDCSTANGNSGNSNSRSDNFIISPVRAITDITISFNVNPTWTCTPTQGLNGLLNQNADPFCEYHIMVEMYDLGNLRQVFIKRHNLGASFDISNLMPGTYILKMEHSGQQENHQIVVQ